MIDIKDTSYDGKYLESFLLFIVAQNDTFRKGLIATQTGIKSKLKIPTLKVSNMVQAPTSGVPQHSGKVSIDKRELVPELVMLYLEFTPMDFNQYWTEVQMNPGLLDAMLPRTAESAIIQSVNEENGSWMDKAIWQSEKDATAIADALANGLGDGDNNLIFFDGLQKKIFLAPGTNKVATPIALTAGNIFAELKRVKDATPKHIWDHPNFKLVMNNTTFGLYSAAQKAQSNKGVDETQAGVSMYDGKTIETIQGISDNTIVGGVMTDKVGSNTWIGMNMAAEENALRIDRVANNSEDWFMKSLFTLDVNVAKPEEMVLYTTETYS